MSSHMWNPTRFRSVICATLAAAMVCVAPMAAQNEKEKFTGFAIKYKDETMLGGCSYRIYFLSITIYC